MTAAAPPISGVPGDQSRRSPWQVAAIALAAVAGLAAGLGVADLTSSRSTLPPDERAAVGAATGTSEVTGEAGPAGAGTGPGASSTQPSAPATPAVPTSSTAAVSTSSITPSTTPAATVSVPTTKAPTTTAPVASRPALLSISYLQDARGNLVVPKGGSATVTLVNSGGQPGQWFLRVSPGDFALSVSDGTLAAGSTLTVTVTDVQRKPHSSPLTGFLAPAQRVNVAVVVK